MKWQLLIALSIMVIMVASCAPQPAPPQPAPQAAPEPAPVAEPTPAEDVEVKKEVMTGESSDAKEEGVLRSVGCDRESNTVMFELHNPTKTDLNFYEKVIPTPPNQIKVVLNGLTLSDLTCDADLLAAGETVKCSKTGEKPGDNVKFRKPHTEFDDDLSIVMVGGGDELKFRCNPRGDFTPEVEEDYSTRVE